MEWKIKGGYRVGLLAGVAAVALLTGVPAFAAPGPDTQSVTQGGTNDADVQVQQTQTAQDAQSVTQNTTNAADAASQSYQLQSVATQYNTQTAVQGDGVSGGGLNYISQTQNSNHDTQTAKQYGGSNTITQVQNGGQYAGYNTSYANQAGSSNIATQTQQGTHGTQRAVQNGMTNVSTQYSSVYGAGGGTQHVFQSGVGQTATQNQYSASTQNIAQWEGSTNTATQDQSSTATGSYESAKQGGESNKTLQKQYFGAQSSTIHQNGNSNEAYSFQYGLAGNTAYIRQGGNGHAFIGFHGDDYNGKAYVNQFAASSGSPNTAMITQYGNSGGHNSAQIVQGSKQQGVSGDYARIDQGNYSQGSYNGAATLTGVDRALVKQTGSKDYAVVRQLNSGTGEGSTNTGYVYQHGNGSSYAGIYQGGFLPGARLERLNNAHRPFMGPATFSAYHPDYASWFQFATNDKSYINQWNGASATGGTNNANTNLAGSYQNVAGSYSKINQGSKSVGVYGDTGKVYQCSGGGFGCTTGNPFFTRGGFPIPFPPGNVANRNNGSYGNDIAKLYQTANNDYALVSQFGSHSNALIHQSSNGDTAHVVQYGSANSATVTQAPGPNGTGSDVANVYQGGASNNVGIAQNGNADLATVTQTGLGDNVALTQNGNSDSSTITQSNANDFVSLTQNANGDSWNISQSGANDSFTGVQNIANDHAATVTQTGNGATASIVH